MKKYSIMGLTLLLTLFTVLAACTPKKETVTLTVYSQLANSSGEMKGWFAEVLEKKFNVKINIVNDGENIYTTRVESGNLGDIVVWGEDGIRYKNAVEKNLLFDWEQDGLLDEFGPYIKENFGKALEKNRNLNGNNKLLGFGHDVALNADDHASFFYTWDIRYDLYERLNKPEIKDLDDLVELFKEMKKLEPLDEAGTPTYALSLWPDWDAEMVMYVKAMATAYYGLDELGIGLYNVETGDYHGALEENGPYIQMLKFFNRLFQEGLIDPDSMTQTYDKMIEKVQRGGTFFSIFNYAGNIAYNTSEHVNAGKIMLSLAPSEATPLVYGLNPMGGEYIWSIGSKTQYPELAMEIINWLSTPEGRMTVEYGPKDLNWYYDEEGYTKFTELGKKMRQNLSEPFPADSGYTGTFKDGSYKLGGTTWSLDAINPESKQEERFHWDYWKSNQGENLNDVHKRWREEFSSDNNQQYLEKHTNYKVAIATSFSKGSRDAELNAKWGRVIKEITDGSWKAIYAKDDKEFNIYINEMTRKANGHGYQLCLEWSQQEALRRHTLEQQVKNSK
ncbi:extracellular solute-binding protein [Haploplasma axanthum]|uniref:Maltose-binding periplasmic proteins/domains n=1 Tax=Haploplasma axanthum TaxID=29552 RepID=A0A449BFA0_HAPAX|nr:extracellular solute-binding protein [Haploplasma axanthum]VEU81116.1 Maltose-binding periplasmic proteins/domains [Haploplasma axanthum]